MPCPIAHCAVLPGSRLRRNDATGLETVKQSGRRGTGHSCAFIHALHPRVLVIPAQERHPRVVVSGTGIHRGMHCGATWREILRCAQNDNGHDMTERLASAPCHPAGAARRISPPNHRLRDQAGRIPGRCSMRSMWAPELDRESPLQREWCIRFTGTDSRICAARRPGLRAGHHVRAPWKSAGAHCPCRRATSVATRPDRCTHVQWPRP